MGDDGGVETARGNVQRDVPAMVEPRRLHQTDLADDLGPKLKRGLGFLPVTVLELRPVRNVRVSHRGLQVCAGTLLLYDAALHRKVQGLPGMRRSISVAAVL